MPTAKSGMKCPYLLEPKYVVIHNTANDASAENEIRYMQGNDKEVSYHFAVDDKEAVQGVPLNRNAWHAGDGGKGDGNRHGIAIEICYSKSGGARFTQAEKNGAELAATLLDKYGWDISRLKKHQDFSGKYCPHRTLDMGWDRFVAMVRENMAKPTTTAKTYKDDYDEGGVTYSKAKNFSIRYLDGDKRKGGVKRYINGGFFAYYREDNTGFTLPVGHLVCDIPKVPEISAKYLTKSVYGSRLVYPSSANQSQQFKGKPLTTLLVTFEGKARIEKVLNLPSGTQYAISGVPVVRDGQAATMDEVKSEGYGTDSLYNTSRNLLGLRDGEIWIITLKTSTSNYIESGEIWSKLKGQGFDDVIALDGGGSYIRVEGLTRRSTGGKRPINNIIVF